MPFTVVRTIGTTGNFATVQAWDDAAPTNLVTAEQSAAGSFAVTTFIQGETLTFVGSGATGKFLDTDSTGVGTGTYIRYGITAGNPAAADVVTGDTSGATCTLSSSTPTDTGVVWEGRCQNQGFSSSGTIWTATGNTTSTTAYLFLTTDTGASFRDHASELTNPLRIDATKGATLTTTGGGGTTVSMSVNNTRMSNIQIQATGDQGRSLVFGGSTTILSNCIVEGRSIGTGVSVGVLVLSTGNTCTVRNCVFVLRQAYADHMIALQAATSCAFYNCTIVAPFDLAQAPSMVFQASAGTYTIQNCMIFTGSDTTLLNNVGGTYNYTTCLSNITGTANVAKAYFQQEFENAGNANSDFRLSQSSLAIDAGTTDATNAPDDIVGTARPVGGAYDIGAWETAFLVTGRHQSNIRHTRSGRAQDAGAKRKCRKRRCKK